MTHQAPARQASSSPSRKSPIFFITLTLVNIGVLIALFFFFNGMQLPFLTDGYSPSNTPYSINGTVYPTSTVTPSIFIVVAIQDIPRGVIIRPDMVTDRTYPAEFAPQSAFTSVNDVIGLIASTDIVREEVILARKLVQDYNSLGSRGSDVAAVIEPGRVGITLQLAIENIPQGIAPGDYVDLIFNVEYASSDNYQARSQIASFRSVTNAQVLWLGVMNPNDDFFRPVAPATPTPIENNQRWNSNPPPAYPIQSPIVIKGNVVPITLAILPQDSVILSWAKENAIGITLVMRSARSQGLPDTRGVTLDYVFTRYGVHPSNSNYVIQQVNSYSTPIRPIPIGTPRP